MGWVSSGWWRKCLVHEVSSFVSTCFCLNENVSYDVFSKSPWRNSDPSWIRHHTLNSYIRKHTQIWRRYLFGDRRWSDNEPFFLLPPLSVRYKPQHRESTLCGFLNCRENGKASWTGPRRQGTRTGKGLRQLTANLSQESAISLIFLFLNSCSSSTTLAISVVQTGVKSPGWVKSIPHELPSHLWKAMGPIVVSAQKSGNTTPNTGGIFFLKCRKITSEFRTWDRWRTAWKFLGKSKTWKNDLDYCHEDLLAMLMWPFTPGPWNVNESIILLCNATQKQQND